MSFALDDKYRLEEGTIILTGVQALVRLPLDQHRADRRAGHNTATLISGYRGSPLGGIDFLLQANRALLDQHHVVFMPGVNEDLGATAVLGSQMANLLPKPRYDGVLGMWYGKAPGVDRSGDVFKHGNLLGVGRLGGVLAVAGDDPVAKSSTLPSQSEVALYDAHMPVLYPGTVQEIIEFGRYGFELSRYTGLWVGLKVITNLADAYCTAAVAPIANIALPAFTWQGWPWQHTQNPALIAPFSLRLEQELHEGRLHAARLFAAANKLNAMTARHDGDWQGIAAAGKTYYDVREALLQLGLDDEALRRCGIRLLKIGMLYPLEPQIVRDFARGLEEILVVEEKRAFLELFLRDALYDLPDRPRVAGKTDEQGSHLVPGHGELDPDTLLPILAARLRRRVPAEMLDKRLAALQPPAVASISLPVNGTATARLPFFCSGCPHNRSTVVPDGSLSGGGIGCHGMSLMMDRQTTGITHMGGEGVQWVGASFFSDTPHMYQNLGDGTLFHSGTLAIRQAVSAGANITYKILYNDAVAMTGGQPVDGNMPVPELTRALAAEGVRKIVVCSHDTGKYGRAARWADDVTLWPRERLDEAQALLRDIPGVTVLIYDQPCAADLRRKRKRGEAPDPPMRVFINEAACEGCGDCGRKSNCLSVFPVDTEFGRKTQIHQSSCNKDYTCLDGDCPAFITVMPNAETAQTAVREEAAARLRQLAPRLDNLPAPRRLLPSAANIYMVGIGGTGVVTITHILGTAALLDGKHTLSLDQTGLSQKGGAVVSHLKILDRPQPLSTKVGAASADAFLVFDVLAATSDKNLRHAHPQRTVAVVSSSEIPTGQMVTDTGTAFPPAGLLRRRLEAVSRAADNVYLDSVALAENLFGSHMMANMITVGAAFQAGLLPLSAAAIEEAIDANGVAVGRNRQAFRAGRLAVADPAALEQIAWQRPGALTARPTLTPQARMIVDSVGASGELRRLLEIRVPELIAYQDEAYARRYAAFVRRVLAAEQEAGVDRTALGEAVARYLFKLMAYKDEYEVARLHLQPEVQETLRRQFGPGAKITYRLHPPFLRALGLKQKIAFGHWFDLAYRLLYALRRLRGTPLDPFGYAHVRRVERELVEEYRALIAGALAGLSPQTYAQAVRLAELPDMVRGYEAIKLENVARYRAAIETMSQPQPSAAAVAD